LTQNQLLRRAFYLSVITIIYNIAEGLISVFFGVKDDTLVLLGFGTDSFVEFISGLGIMSMVWRMKFSAVSERSKFERTALLITGISFWLLTAGLVAGSVINIIYKVTPGTTIPGIIISAISILTMYFLMQIKLKTGRELKSEAIIADANCTKTCFYLSIILFTSSLLYIFFRISYIDIAGSLGIAVFAFLEGREALEKSKKKEISCGCNCKH
jgi:divalent metal cation (Fe/Co/Zn/Cd) transporter